ncbi:hypothetical protein AMTRI_Chr06g170760 [Amborella trichopoda]|uniref:GIR1-like zinc ribbon domain-containing protein n=1 Tax=Amborella trichopoda TaxID=13333 RepID=W1PGG4_AMBTC|nr:uncharacterized protein LOC18434355 [Amborella trichopoda]ERN06165.1 hypothetical protein AMTR_s00016p00119260 [Amborella trichopoda]|eukprot:XP_006844490.1 uncharacterized protein LOC18434355 [Amborella trichopoda]
MTTPKMAMTSSLERSFQACSINHGHGATSSSASPPESQNLRHANLELNSEMSLPYQWEQCLDLKTGEVYFIDWNNGKKEKDDPRLVKNKTRLGYNSSDEESGNESEDSSSSSTYFYEDYLVDSDTNQDQILVVAGCKRCLMYFMLPKMAMECPKCRSLLLRFNGSGKALL